MKWILIFSLVLSGCAEIPQNSALLNEVKQAEIKHVEAFNKLRNVNMPIPEIEFGNAGGDYAETSNYAGAAIIINPDLCAKDLDDCENDTIPHELAHWAVEYYGGEVSHMDITPNMYPGRAPNARIQYGDGHTAIWCDAMRAFGGIPEKHGYCH